MPWQIPELEALYFKYGFGMKGLIEAYLRSKGRDPSTIWDQIEYIISETIRLKEDDILSQGSRKLITHVHSNV